MLNICIILQVHFQHDSLLKAFSQPISVVCCQLSTDWEHTFYVCLRCRSWQQVLGKWNKQWVFIGIRDPELKSTVFWVGPAVSKISNQLISKSAIDQPTRGANNLDRIYVNDMCYTNVKVVTSAVKSDHKSLIAYTGPVLHTVNKQRERRAVASEAICKWGGIMPARSAGRKFFYVPPHFSIVPPHEGAQRLLPTERQLEWWSRERDNKSNGA